jgi:tRNA A37 threonylcarbamoyladenosine modification protein TsaB
VGGDEVIVLLDARMGEVYHGRFSARHGDLPGGGLLNPLRCRFPTRPAGSPAATD